MKKNIIINLGYKEARKNFFLDRGLLYTITTFLFIGLLNTFSIPNIFAQVQNNTLLADTHVDLIRQDVNATNNTKSFMVTFDSLVVNNDHDPITAGEWLMDAYVNDMVLDLFPGSISVNDGDTVFFDTNNVVNITVPNNESGFIRIGTVGWENDVGFEPLPVFFSLMDTRVPFYIYDDLVQHAVVPFVGVQSANDPNGYVAIQYNNTMNFGVGTQSVCSQSNAAATINIPFFEDECDYILNFTIEDNLNITESHVGMPNGSSIATLLTELCPQGWTEDEMSPNPRLGWTNPRIPVDPDPQIDCRLTTTPSNSSINS